MYVPIRVLTKQVTLYITVCTTYELASRPNLKGRIEINCRIDGLEKIWIYSFHSKVHAQFVLVQIEKVRISMTSR